jgi:bis(5'-nucleosidyl)-tetraphosphatase
MFSVQERSAGVVAFQNECDPVNRPYLLIHSARVRSPRARWEFPKGGIEWGETPRQAAAREFVEETGLRCWRFRDSFEWSTTYYVFPPRPHADQDGHLLLREGLRFVDDDANGRAC